MHVIHDLYRIDRFMKEFIDSQRFTFGTRRVLNIRSENQHGNRIILGTQVADKLLSGHP